MLPRCRRSAPSSDFPWWLAVAVGARAGSRYLHRRKRPLAQVFATVAKGIGITVFVTVVAFALASAIGLGIALMGLSGRAGCARSLASMSRSSAACRCWCCCSGSPSPARRPSSRAGTALTAPLQSAGLVGELKVRDVSLLWRAIMALTIGYSAFISEVFRAGIQAVDQGQIEAAKALGLSRYARFRLIVFPQAIRTILPPLGNDFVAMVKDSSLVSVLGVADITQMGKIYAAGSFRFFETYSIVAYIYLILTVGLSLALRALEKPA